MHFDISYCKLSREEILFICACVRNSVSLMAVHMGMNQIDPETRLAARSILNAQVKYPFRSLVHMHQHIRTAEDKLQLLVLNSFAMSALPQAASKNGTQIQEKPLSSLNDVKDKIKSYASTPSEPSVGSQKANLTDVMNNVSHAQQKQARIQKPTVDTSACQDYFDDAGKRTSDMIHFLDLYGRRFRYINIDNPNLPKQEVMNLLSLGVGETKENRDDEHENSPSYIKM